MSISSHERHVFNSAAHWLIGRRRSSSESKQIAVSRCLRASWQRARWLLEAHGNPWVPAMGISAQKGEI